MVLELKTSFLLSRADKIIFTVQQFILVLFTVDLIF